VLVSTKWRKKYCPKFQPPE